MAINESGTITLKILAQDLASGNVGKFIANIDRLAKQGGLMGSVMQGVGQSFGQMLNPVGLVKDAIGAVADFMGDSIGAASDYTEALSKVNVVFGDQATAITSWASTAAEQMGLSETAALSAAGTFGNLFDALGLAKGEAVAMSQDIVQLAADIGSFNNVPVAEALDALRAGLVGETEPMRRFGANLTAATVEAKALALGLADTKSAITEADKVQARYALILEQTSNAQGDFARTADGLANSTKTFDARMANLSASIGRLMEGPATAFLGFLDGVISRLSGASGASAAAQQMVDAIESINKAASGGQAADVSTYASRVEELRAVLSAPLPRNVSDEFATIRGHVRRLGPEFIAMSGQSVESLQAVAQASIRSGEDFQTFRSRAFALANGTTSATTSIVDSWQLAGRLVPSAVGTMATQAVRRMRPLVRQLPRLMTHAVVDMEGTIKGGKERIVEQFRQLAFQSKNPFAEKNYAGWLKQQEQRALRGMRAAVAAGRPGIAAQHAGLAADIRAEYQGLPSYMASIAGRVVGALSLIPGMGGLGAFNFRPPGRASGGPVYGGRSYLVGENGPEVVTMDGNGHVTPNGALGGINVTVNLQSLAVPSEAEGIRIGRTLAPIIQRELARQGARP